MGKKCAGTQIAHAIAIHAKTAHLALALMAFLVNLTNEGSVKWTTICISETFLPHIGNPLNTSMPLAPIAGSWNTRIGLPPTRRMRKSRPSTKPTGIARVVEGRWNNHQQKGGRI